MSYKAEYIWIDGTEPTARLRSKTKVITEKRATFACTPGIFRPTNATSAPGFFLAGDYTAGPYPATLEGAIASGKWAAEEAVAYLQRK